MSGLPIALLPHRVQVEQLLGDGSEGPVYAAPVQYVPCRQEGTLTVNADGAYVGSVKLYLRRDWLANFVRGSRVTLAAAAGVGTVSAVVDHSDGGLGAWEHLEIVVTT